MLAPLQGHGYAAVAKRCAFLAQAHWLKACGHRSRCLREIRNRSEISHAAMVDSRSFHPGSFFRILVTKD
jgi:hypothetical protein